MFPANRNVRIGGAVLAGIVIILGAFFLREQQQEGVSEISAVPVQQAERLYVPYEDADGDGQNDWQDILDSRIRSTTDVQTISTSGDIEDDTLTDAFARSFFEDFIRGNASGVLTETNQEDFIDSSLSSLSSEVTNDYYTDGDIAIGPDTGSYLRTYGNSIAGIIQKHSTQTENELVIFQRGMESGEPADLEPLQDFVTLYDSLIKQTLIIAAPPALTDQHLGLINSYLAVRNDIDGMSQGITDPLYAALRVGRYQTDMESLYAALSDIYLYIYNQGIRYTEEEPGSMFKI